MIASYKRPRLTFFLTGKKTPDPQQGEGQGQKPGQVGMEGPQTR